MGKSVKKNTSVKKTTEVKKTTKKNVSSINKDIKRIEKDTSQVNPEFTDAFIQEVNEDVKNDSFKVLWNRYGVFIIAFVVIAVSAAVSFEKIKSWKVEQNQFKTESYMTAAQLQENSDDTIKALQKINQQEQGIFGDFAKLQIANVLFNQNKNDEALATLQSLVDDKQVNSEVKNIALIKIATYKVDELSRSEFETLVKPIIDANNSWTPIANDLLAMSAIKDGDIQTAKNIYENILKVKDLPESFRTKVQDMLSSISDM